MSNDRNPNRLLSSKAHNPPLHLQSARDVVHLLKIGAVTALELIDVVEARLEATDFLLHSTPITCFERARKAARELVHPNTPKPGYLYGLPVLIKDCDAVSGVRWTNGSPLHRDRIPKFSNPIVWQLEQMGAIVVGKTNTPEFCAGGHSFNTLFQTTRSPYDTRTSAGGSSGGSAAALGGTQIWLATGSDLGGSLRIPAAFCGVVGFRCTPGRIPRARLGPNETSVSKLPYYLHSVSGPMARGVHDLALFLDALTSKKSSEGAAAVGWEGYTIPPPLPSLSESETSGHWQAIAKQGSLNPGKFRTGFSTLGLNFSQEVTEICRNSANLLSKTMSSHDDDCTTRKNYMQSCSEDLENEEKLPLAIEFETPFDLSVAERCFFIIRSASFHSSFNLEYSTEEIASMKPEIQWNIACHLATDNPEGVLGKAVEEAKELFNYVNERLFTEKIDILVTPATLDASFDQKLRYPSKNYGGIQEQSELNNYLQWMLPSCLISATSSPALVMPAGKLKDGRPVGIQLVGKWGADATVLEAAAALESQLNLGMDLGLDTPICGRVKLQATGPITQDEAATQHEKAIELYHYPRYFS